MQQVPLGPSYQQRGCGREAVFYSVLEIWHEQLLLP